MEKEKPSKPVLCPDGTYRWSYQLNMYKNPIILITVIKALLMSVAIVAILMFIFDIFDGQIDMNFTEIEWKPILIFSTVFLGIIYISYLIVAKTYGGKYCVLFEMDNEKITHRQMDSQFDKTQALGWITAMAGLATGNPTLVGMGINTSVRNEMTSYYKNVKRIIPKRYMNTIKVNNRFLRNQIYVDKEDFDFVLNYLKEHCHKK